jgi:hypothetical protein
MYVTSLGQNQGIADCSGWEKDPESFSKVVAEHYIRTVMKLNLKAKSIKPYYPNKRAMEVWFSSFPKDIVIGVSFVKLPDYVIAARIKNTPAGPKRCYTYQCQAGQLSLTERKC